MLTGYFMGALGLPVHAARRQTTRRSTRASGSTTPTRWCSRALAVATAAVILALRRRRPWDAAIFALAPSAVGHRHRQLGLPRHRAGRVRPATPGRDDDPSLAGVLLGLGGAAKLWPLFLLGPLLVLACGPAGCGPRSPPSAAAWSPGAVNLPVGDPATADSWDRFFELNTTRPDRLGHALVHRPLPGRQGGTPAPPATRARSSGSATTSRPSTTCRTPCSGWPASASAVLRLRAPRRPRLAQLAFLVVAAFLIFSKVWSQQYVLWLLPLVVLARPRWGAFLAWRSPRSATSSPFYARAARRGRQAGHPRGDVRAGLEPAAGHGGGALRPGGQGDLAPGAGRGPRRPTPTTRTAASSTARRTPLADQTPSQAPPPNQNEPPPPPDATHPDPHTQTRKSKTAMRPSGGRGSPAGAGIKPDRPELAGLPRRPTATASETEHHGVADLSWRRDAQRVDRHVTRSRSHGVPTTWSRSSTTCAYAERAQVVDAGLVGERRHRAADVVELCGANPLPPLTTCGNAAGRPEHDRAGPGSGCCGSTSSRTVDRAHRRRLLRHHRVRRGVQPLHEHQQQRQQGGQPATTVPATAGIRCACSARGPAGRRRSPHRPRAGRAAGSSSSISRPGVRSPSKPGRCSKSGT